MEQNKFISVINFIFTEYSFISYIKGGWGDITTFKELRWLMEQEILGNTDVEARKKNEYTHGFKRHFFTGRIHGSYQALGEGVV